ncbi:MAG TPA: amino acid adenylation domain-containing protein, partial [Herpetosiphonaceae bacterium]
MTIIELLDRLRELNITLWAEGDRLRFQAPKGALTDELRAMLAEHKAEVLVLLREAATATQAEHTPIRRAPHDDRLPLSFAQQRLWFLDQLEPNSPLYNIISAVRLTGRLDTSALQRSFDAIAERHAVLRTTFATVDQQPVQVIAPPAPIDIRFIDLRHLPAAEREATAQELAGKDALQPFDLRRGPLLRVTLLQLEATEHVVLFTMHHIISDGWSIGVMIRELATLYLAFADGRPHRVPSGHGTRLPELPIQYVDFAVWQRQWLQDQVLDQQLACWQQQLKGAPAALELPTDRPRPLRQTFRGATLPLDMPPVLSQALNTLSKREGATLFMTLLAAFQTLLFRYSGQDDILVGSPIANRTRPELDGLIGMFVNTLVLRTDLSGNPTFVELLRRVRQVALDAFAHQDLPFERLVEAIQPTRDLSRSPLFQVVLVLQNAPAEVVELPGLALQPIAVASNTAKFDLTLSITEQANGLAGALEYNTDLFDRTTIERMIGHFQTLLAGLAADPEQRIGDLPLLTEAERHQLLVEWNATAANYPQDVCLHTLIEAQAARTPAATAVVFEGETLTYAALNDRANQLAHHLRALGVRSETHVAICIERSLDLVVGLLGILKAGGCYVPLDPSYPPERLRFMLEDAQAHVLLTQQRLLGALPATDAQIVALDAQAAQIAQESTAPVCSGVTPEHLAYIIYTSGSTGRPKGAMISHRGLVNYLSWCTRAYNLSAGSGTPVHSPIGFDLTVTSLFAPLITGQRVLLLPEDHGLEGLGAALAPDAAFSLVKLTPAHVDLLNTMLPANTLAGCANALIIGGEALRAETVSAWRAFAPQTRLINEYGPTETVVGCCVYEVPPTGDVPSVVPIGRPIANTQLYILDRHLNPVPVGVAGELYIGGDGVGRGYLNRPDLTATQFIPDPFSDRPGARLYRTGDLARYLPDGVIDFLGRIDHQVKLRGFRIELGEIEAVLTQHPQIREAVVLVRQHKTGDARLVAYVVEEQRNKGTKEQRNKDASTDSPPSPVATEAEARRGSGQGGRGDEGLAQNQSEGLIPALRAFLKERLPDYMLPSAFVVLETLPLTVNGKVDRRALPEPDAARPEIEHAFVAPRNPVEQTLAEIWQAVLGVEQIGIHDNFFALGGHSLLATQLVARVRDALQVDVPLRDVFAVPTVTEMAALIETIHADGNTKDDTPPLRPVDRDGPQLPSFTQERFWFLSQLEPASPLYNISAMLRIAGPLDSRVFSQSLNALISRHEILRTTFMLVEGQPMQVIAPHTPIDLPYIDLRSLPAAEREATAQELADEDALRPFDLAHGPLLRITLIQLDDTVFRVLFTTHHIIFDGWSTGLLVGELWQLYSAFAQDEQPALPELPVQYADYAVWQRSWFHGEALERKLRYWKSQLGSENSRGAVPLLDLPTDRPRPSMLSFSGKTIKFTLPQPLTDAVVALSQHEQATLFMTLLAVWQTLLFRYSGQDDIAIGTPTANRNRRELEPLIGCFINTIVIRTDLSGAPSFRELLGRVRQSTLGAFDHQDLPFEVLVDALQPARDLSHNPIFQVMFVMQNTPMPPIDQSEFQLSMADIETRTAKTDLSLEIVPIGAALVGTLVYNTDLFDRTTIERMLAHYMTLLEGIVANPELPITHVPLLTEAERRQMLIDWNRSAAEYPRDAAVHQLIEAQAARSPETTAIVYEGTSLTYAELNARANQLAHYLRDQGVGPDVLVALMVERSLEMIEGMLAILKAGGAYVPLDPAYPAERLQYMLSHSRAAVILTQNRLISRLPEHQAQVFRLDADW